MKIAFVGHTQEPEPYRYHTFGIGWSCDIEKVAPFSIVWRKLPPFVCVTVFKHSLTIKRLQRRVGGPNKIVWMVTWRDLR